jgi:DNA-binding transcriptional MerR regulator
MRIGELAKKTGVSVRAIRHYDAEGLLEVHRARNGYREFPDSEVQRVLRIRHLLGHGFTLDDIRPLTSCLTRPASDEEICDHVLALYEAKLRELDARLGELRAVRQLSCPSG